MNQFSKFMITLLVSTAALQLNCAQQPEAKAEEAPKMEDSNLQFDLVQPKDAASVFNLKFRPHFDLNDLNKHDFRFDREAEALLTALTPEERNVVNQLHAARQERYFFKYNRENNPHWANSEFASKKYTEFYLKEEALKEQFAQIIRNPEKREHILDRLDWLEKREGAGKYFAHTEAQFEISCKTESCKKMLALLVANKANLVKKGFIQLKGANLLPLAESKVVAVKGSDSKAVLHVEASKKIEGKDAQTVSQKLQIASINHEEKSSHPLLSTVSQTESQAADKDTITIVKVSETISHRPHDQY